MPYEPNIDVVQVLAATMHLLENSQYPERHSASIQAVIEKIRQCIVELEAVKIPPSREELNNQAPHTMGARTRAK